jgi:hypothetical protein
LPPIPPAFWAQAWPASKARVTVATRSFIFDLLFRVWLGSTSP